MSDPLKLISFYFKNNFFLNYGICLRISIKEYPCCSGVQAAQMFWSLNCLNTLSLIIGKSSSTLRRISALWFFKWSFICKA